MRASEKKHRKAMKNIPVSYESYVTNNWTDGGSEETHEKPLNWVTLIGGSG